MKLRKKAIDLLVLGVSDAAIINILKKSPTVDIFQNLQELERCLFFLVGISKRENLLCIATRQIGFAVSVINRLQS